MLRKYPYTDFNEYNLDWLVKQVRDLTDEWAAQKKEWSDVQTEWENYKKYIDDYFENLDVSQEISDKLDEMAADGTLTQLVQPYFQQAFGDIADVVTDWLDANIVQETGYVIDKSLTVEDAAADAEQVGKIISWLSDVTANLCTVVTGRYNVNSSGNIVAASNNYIGMKSPIPCDPNTDYYIETFDSGVSTNSSFYVGWYDGNGDFISPRESQTRAANNLKYMFTSPNDAAYMAFAQYNSSGVSGDAKISIAKTGYIGSYIPPLTANDENAKSAISALNATLNTAIRYVDYNSYDLDDMRQSGYNIVPYSQVLTNAPDSGSAYRIIINFQQLNVTHQYYINASAKMIYVRVFASGAWLGWNKLTPDVSIYNEAQNTTVLDPDYKTYTGTFSYSGKRARIVSYNVAHWNNDTASWIGDSGNEEKLINFKKLVMFADADAFCTPEDYDTIDTAETLHPLDELFQPLYSYKTGQGGACIYTKENTNRRTYSLVDQDSNPIITVRGADITLDDKTLRVYTCHLSVSSSANRAIQLNAIFDQIITVEDPDYWVLCGDMNTIEASDVTTLDSIASTYSLEMANGGYLGWLSTHKTDLPLDNLLAGPNVIIRNVDVLGNWFKSLYSDHYPVIIDVELLNI